MLKIKEVEKGGAGESYGFEPGDAILAFDGHEAIDSLDYVYYDAQENFKIEVLAKSGEKVIVDMEKEEDESMGLTFEDDGMKIRTCHNDCIFCFVRQMPSGMRDSLYVKDDDYRQSFLCGNFVTLTNLTDKDVERIVRMKLGPLYVSVHTMNGDLRCKMLRNRFAYKIREYLDIFEKNGIAVNAQNVIVPGVNDGKELEYTLNELYKYKNILSIAAVPCGITKYRDGLYHIDDINAEYAAGVIRQVNEINAKHHSNLVCLADEYYFKAGLPLPPYESYGEFLQIENGVGMSAKFLRDVEELIEDNEKPLLEEGRYLTVCGTSVYRFMLEVVNKIAASCEGVSITLLPVENVFFGKTVNCTGLLTGVDIVNAVKASGYDYDVLLIPNNCLMQFEDKFLDDMTLTEMSRLLGKKVVRARMKD